MVVFPQNEFPLEVDPFRQLRYSLRLWAHRRDLLPLCLIILGVQCFIFIARTIYILKSFDDVEFLIEISATYPIPLLAIAKLTSLLIQRKRIRFLFRAVSNKFWDIGVAGSRLRNYLEKRYKIINLLLLGHTLTSNSYVVLHLLFAEVPIPEGRTRWLPILVSLPMDLDKSPLHEFLYVIMALNMFMSVLGHGFFDFLFVYGAQHLSGQFMLLAELLQRLDEELMERFRDLEKFKSEAFQDDVRKRIAVCVRHHNLLLRYGDELRNLTSVIFGVQLLTTLISLVLVGYTLSENLEEMRKSTMLLSFVFSSTVQFSIFAIQSADLHHQSASVAEAAYQSNWYLFNAKAKRGLTLLILNSQKGIIIYAAGLIAMDNELIVKMGQRVFSFITLLRSLDEQRQK